jgi:hypothetical protein
MTENSKAHEVEVLGVTFKASLVFECNYWLASCDDVLTWGIGTTEDEALADLALQIRNDCDWFCGVGARVPMVGPMAAERTTYQRLFGCKTKGMAS